MRSKSDALFAQRISCKTSTVAICSFDTIEPAPPISRDRLCRFSTSLQKPSMSRDNPRKRCSHAGDRNSLSLSHRRRRAGQAGAESTQRHSACNQDRDNRGCDQDSETLMLQHPSPRRFADHQRGPIHKAGPHPNANRPNSPAAPRQPEASWATPKVDCREHGTQIHNTSHNLQ